jgi:signal transduction histidine kinase
LDLSWLQGRASAAEPEVSAKLEALDSGIDEAMNIKRRVVENLRPALLDHFGLPTALQSHFMETCEHAGLHCRTRVAEVFQKLPQELAIALFRVGQESLTNIIRHAHASNVELTFELDEANYHMSIADDGVGIPAGRLGGTMSHGLVGMRHRIESLNGQFTISANTPTGTRIDVVVPRSREG